MIKPIWQVIKYIFQKLWKGISWICNKIYMIFKVIIKFIYQKILRPIGLFLQFISIRLWRLLCWIGNKIYRFFRLIFEKILYPIYSFFKFMILKLCHFVYQFILYPIYKVFKFIFKQLYRFIKWLILVAFPKIGYWIWRGIKLLYQLVSVSIVVTISVILCICYTMVIYPFKIIFIETIGIFRTKEIPFLILIMRNPYYLFHRILEKNQQQLKRFKEENSDLAIFIHIKNIVGYIPASLYPILLYPIDWVWILLLKLFLR